MNLICTLCYTAASTLLSLQQTVNVGHARFVRRPTSRASSVSIFREMSSAFTECVKAPLEM
uniref:Putative ovule protein n=1 Tax=Solanum chacoense TaxID=4108 RepID=A0A0V0H439_SOLCH